MSSGGSDLADYDTWLLPLLVSRETALLGVDLDGRARFWSPGAQALFGWTADEVLGRIPPLVPQALRQEWRLQLDRVRETGQPSATAETQRVARDGHSITVLQTSAPVRDRVGRVSGVLDVLTDASSLKQLDEESRALAQVRERELVALDLHDGLIQSLYAVVLNLGAQEHTLENAGLEDALGAIRAARAEVERVIGETRAYVVELRDRGVAPRRFASGLRLLLDSLRLNAGIAVQLDDDSSVEAALEPEVRGHLLYLIREALSNILRHARATHVRVQLERVPEAVVVSIADDGVGFVVPDPARSNDRHRGLRTMTERARMIGGQLSITSAPGQGTQVRLNIPL